MRYLGALVLCLMLAGCASPGRFSVIDLDGRSDTQRAADSPAEQAMWTGRPDMREPLVKEKSWYMTALSSIGSFINFRVRLISFEWGVPNK